MPKSAKSLGGNPNWTPGRSGNPGGRPPASMTFAERVRALVEPDEIICFAQRVMRGKDESGAPGFFSTRERMDAAIFLSERGWGKPPTQIQIEARLEGRIVSVVDAVDPRRLDMSALESLERLLSVAAGEPLLLGTKSDDEFPTPEEEIDAVFTPSDPGDQPG